MEMGHPGHPFWVIEQVWDEAPGAALSLVLAALVGVAGLSLVINARRIVRALAEVLAAAAAARTSRRAGAPATEEPAADALSEP